MARGRKPLPKELLKLRGTDRRDRDRPSSTLGDPVPVDKVGAVCQVPGLKGASRRARDIYWSLCKRVAAQGMLDPAFCHQMLFYAVEYDHFIECCEDIKKNGLYVAVETKKGTMLIQNPAIKQRVAALEKLLKIGSNFGFSPVDRQRLKIQAEDTKSKGVKAIFAALIETDDQEGPDEQ